MDHIEKLFATTVSMDLTVVCNWRLLTTEDRSGLWAMVKIMIMIIMIIIIITIIRMIMINIMITMIIIIKNNNYIL